MEQLTAKSKIAIGRSNRASIGKMPKDCTYYECDVAEFAQLERIFRMEHKIETVFHCAGSVQNALLKNLNAKSFEHIFATKVKGTRNLLKLCKQYNVKRLVVLSSVAAVYGSVGQANYAVANSEMNRLLGLKADDKLQCLSISLGPIGDVGMLSSADKQLIRRQIEADGWQMMGVDDVIQNIIGVLNQTGQFIFASGSKLKEIECNQTRESTRSESIARIDENTIKQVIARFLTEISGLKDVPENRGFMSLGVDSLMIEQLRETLCPHFGIEISPAEMYEFSTMCRLVSLIHQKTTLKPSTKSLVSVDFDSTSSESESLSAEEGKQQIAIIGFSGEYPKSNGLDDFFENLLDGQELLDRVEERPNFVNVSSCLKNVYKFDPTIFDVSEEDAAFLDPQIKVLLRVAHCALEDAGLTRERRLQLKIACFTSAEPSEPGLPPKHSRTFPQGSLYGMYAKNQKDFIAAWISHILGLKGPANSVYSACSSSLVVIANAVQLLQLNEDIDLCLIGGINLVEEIGHRIERGSPMSKEEHCRPFSKSASGIIRGSGCGVVLCKRLKDAHRDNDTILAVIKSITVNNDANRNKSNFLAPSLQGQQEVISQSLASIDDSNIDYIECHSTGTLIGDAIEIKALQMALSFNKSSESKPLIGSLKANIGHSFAASGMMSLAKCLKILETRKVPPQINIEELIDEIDENLLQISTTTHDLSNRKPLKLMINNFGIGGTNACMILEEPGSSHFEPKIYTQKQIEKYHLLIITAQTKLSCIAYCHKLAEFLLTHMTIDMAALSNTLLNYRDHHNYRFAIVVSNVVEAITMLNHVNEESVKMTKSDRKYALYFCHQGLQHPKMLQLERQNCTKFNKICSKFQYNPDNDSSMPSIASKQLFEVFACVNEFLQQLNIPLSTVTCGHSIGEYGSMLAGGAISYQDGLSFVEKRGRLIEGTKNAKTFAVQTECNDLHQHLHLSAILSSNLRSFVCASEVAEIVRAFLNGSGLQWKELRADFGFHSQFMDPILSSFGEMANELRLNNTLRVPIISNVDGHVISNASMITADYLTRHLRQPVRLDLTLQTLEIEFPDVDTILEIGPTGILGSLLNSRFNHIQTVQSFNQHRHHPSPLLFQAIAHLWELGFDVNLRELFGSDNKILRGLPNYAFDERQLSWSTNESTHGSKNVLNSEESVVKNEFQVYKAIWKYFGELKLDNTCNKMWLFTDSASTFSSISTEIRVIEINSACIHHLNEDQPDIILHACLEPNYDNSFHFLHSLRQIQWKQGVKLISVGIFENPLHSISIGPLEELTRIKSNIQEIHVLFDEWSSLKLFLASNFLQLFNLSSIPRFRCSGKIILQLDYTSNANGTSNANDTKDRINDKEVFLLIGGNGSLGRAIIEQLSYTHTTSTIIVLSRRPERINSNLRYYDADITNLHILNEQIEKIKDKFKRIDFTYFLSGKKSSGKMIKGRDEMEEVMKCKIEGLLNLIKSSKSNNLQLGSLILCSSLSSISGLAGIEDYCSANCFLDHQADLNTTNHANVLSVQLPPLRSSKFMVNETDPIFNENSIDINKAAKLLVEMRKMEGIYALSNSNPLQIRQFFQQKLNINPSHEQLMSITMSKPERLNQIWRSLLPIQLTEIQQEDDFFGLGGNSLNALQLIWKIQEEFGVHLLMEKLVINSKFNQLLSLIEILTHPESSKCQQIRPILHHNKQRGLLSLAQEQMWILFGMAEPKTTYNVIFKLEFSGYFDENRAIIALKKLMERQKVLRTRFLDNTCVQQEIIPTDQAFELTFIRKEDQKIEELIEEERNHEFNISINSFRFILLKCNNRYTVLVNQQHIITDGWSISVFAEEFSHFYRNDEVDLPALNIDYMDYAEFTRSQFNEHKCQEYADVLKTLPPQGTQLWPINIPSRNMSTENNQFSIEKNQVEMFLYSSTIEELNVLCSEFGCTRFLLILTAFLKCLDVWRWKSLDIEAPIVIGCPVAGRDHTQTAKLLGYFLNNMVICVDGDLQKLKLEELISLVGLAVGKAQNYADVPFHRAVALLNKTRGECQPVFQVFFNYRHQLDFPSINLGSNLECNVEQLTNNNAFQLSCTVDELNDKAMKITLDFDSKSLNHQIVSSFADHFQSLIEKLRNIDHIDYNFIYPSINNDVIVEFKSVIDMIYDQCEMHSTLIAIEKSNGKMINYGELKSIIIKNSTFLLNKFNKLIEINEMKDEIIIPILLDTNSAVEWILTVMFCGWAYCPMDPNQPIMRTQSMIQKLKSPLLITDQELKELKLEGVTVLNINNIDIEEITPLNTINTITQFNCVESTNLAYVMFTSGSTGEPKAVCIEHQQLSTFVTRSQQQFNINEDSRVAHSVNTVFDVSIFNIFTTLSNGGCLVQKDEILEFTEIVEFKSQLTHLILSSAIFNSLKREQLEGLCQITGWLIVGGETPSSESMIIANHPHNPRLKISQFYGPTETTVWVTINHYEDSDFDGHNIGVSCQPFFLTSINKESPIPLELNSMAVGELWICGDQVGRGYLNSTVSTVNTINEGFVDNFMNRVPRAYRTGDLVRVHNNQLIFLGRRDHQFKINGVRVDPTEIVVAIRNLCNSQQIKQSPQIQISIINTKLIAFVAGKIDNEDMLKSKLAKQLPRYMIPHQFIQLENGFPLNQNEKVDQKRLKELYLETRSTNLKVVEDSLQLSKNGQKLIEIWKQVIDVNDIVPSSNFFEIGGHSLSVLQLKTKLKELMGIELTFDQLYKNSNFQDQLALIEERKVDNIDIIQVVRESVGAKASVYCIHAIGGTIYSYYSMASIWPIQCNVYAIAYKKEYPVDSLKALSTFYYNQIMKHVESVKLPFIILGHSLGGILGWEIAARCLKINQFCPIVCAFDSWVIDNDKLDEHEVSKYLQTRFVTLENSEILIESAIQLCRMLKNHQMKATPVPLTLFKAERLGETALKHAIRKDLTEEMSNSKVDNGWSEFVDDLSIYPCDADHDSIMEPTILTQYLWLFEQLIEQTLLTNH